MNVLITGGAGFLGSVLVSQLIHTGDKASEVLGFSPFYSVEDAFDSVVEYVRYV